MLFCRTGDDTIIISGVPILKKQTFKYTPALKNIIWEEAGISMHFSGSDPLNAKTRFTVAVVPKVEATSILPQQYRLMPTASVTYKITSNVTTLPAPVRVRIQHCAILEKENRLVFMVAHDGPPYCFKPLQGGKFPTGESYGEIEMDKFSFFTIFNNIMDFKMSLAVFVAYLSDNIMHFLVTKNLPANCTQVKNEYKHANLLRDYTMRYYYSTTKISLKHLPIEEENGWHIKPLHQPASIDMHSVHAYEPGCVIPKIELQLEWKGAGEPQKGMVDIEVEGGDMESFTLFCSGQPPVTPAPTSHPLPQPTPPESPRPVAMSDKPTLPLLQHLPTPSGDVINIIQRIAGKSHILGICLLKDRNGDITKNIEDKYKDDKCRIAEEIIHTWLEGTGKTPQSWATLVTVLREIQMDALAHEIEQSIAQ